MRGKYAGRKGYLDSANPRRGDKIWVFVVKEDDTMKHTYVDFTSIRPLQPAPTTWAQAALQQVPNLESKLIELAYEFAKCDMDGHQEDVVNSIISELQIASSNQEERSKATWYRVSFGAGKRKHDKRLRLGGATT